MRRDSRYNKILALDFIHIATSDDVCRWVLLLHTVREYRSSFGRRTLVDEFLVANAGREAKAFVDDLEVLGHQFVTLRDGFVNRSNGAFRPGKLREVEHVRLVLCLELFVCCQGIAPRLSVLE